MRWTDRIGRQLKLRDLHIVLAVAEAGSMSRAADRLAISHPVVSKTIGDLEHALGVRLFDRTAQGTELTQYGRALLGGGTVVFDKLRRVPRRGSSTGLQIGALCCTPRADIRERTPPLPLRARERTSQCWIATGRASSSANYVKAAYFKWTLKNSRSLVSAFSTWRLSAFW